MSAPVWHYARNAWLTACGRRAMDVAITTQEPGEATCKACRNSAESMGETGEAAGASKCCEACGLNTLEVPHHRPDCMPRAAAVRAAHVYTANGSCRCGMLSLDSTREAHEAHIQRVLDVEEVGS